MSTTAYSIEDNRLRILIESMVRDGYSQHDIERAVDRATGNTPWRRFLAYLRTGQQQPTASVQVLHQPARSDGVSAPERRAA